VIVTTENVPKEHTMAEQEEEAILKNLQLGGSGSSSRSYHSTEDEFSHLLPKRGAQNGLDDRDPDYIPEPEEVW
jgi:hypothetical protein